jgi:hypothetical protein
MDDCQRSRALMRQIQEKSPRISKKFLSRGMVNSYVVQFTTPRNPTESVNWDNKALTRHFSSCKVAEKTGALQGLLK